MLIAWILFIAQAVVSGPARLEFTHDQVNTDHYALSVDGADFVTTVATPLDSVPGDLTMDLPSLALGPHRLQVAACNTVENVMLTCAISDPLEIIVQILAKPTNLRIQ